MSDLSISDDELAMLLAMSGDLGEEMNTPSTPTHAKAAQPPVETSAAPAERVLSQEEIDALLASMMGG